MLKFLVPVLASLAVLSAGPAAAQVGDEAVVEAREALRKKDRARLVALRDRLSAARHPLAMWVEYWELTSRLGDAPPAEVETLLARWPGTYVEDRLRNDWLLELGRRRDWDRFAAEHPRYRMNDDREVACYALLLQHRAGADVRTQAAAAWHAQRDLDDGCHHLASTLVQAGRLGHAEVWHELRLSVEANRPRAARAAAALIGTQTAHAIDEVLDQPARWLKTHRRIADPSGTQRELATLALMRLAAGDVEGTVAELENHWSRALGDELAAVAWAAVGRVAAQRLLDGAHDAYQQAWKRRAPGALRLSDETLAWAVRAALRHPKPERERWATVLRTIAAMSPQEQKDPTWVYWKGRALKARARTEAEQAEATATFESIASGLGFYGQLALHELGRPFTLPAAPPPPTEAEREQAAGTPGFVRAMHMARLGLRDEARREWNFTLRGLPDRELLAAAAQACQAADWQICINTSERSRELVDLSQRYPTPYAEVINARAAERGLDPALVLGLIRQETRFMATLRSSVGAAGLMQLMPATARWTARKVGIDWQPRMVDDVDINVRLGTTYLRLLLDDFGGSQAMATAAYNAGPGRPRRWREGPAIDAAAWAENIPFNETRDYVKKVLGNAVVYQQLLGRAGPPLRLRLGQTVGPRDPASPAADTQLP
ncbi:MAG: lytic transglycosylase domain-containing protein [Rubrivivax sp.]|nr:lytic transglycosylase domain-containing protein [Rubrivivax sp.]